MADFTKTQKAVKNSVREAKLMTKDKFEEILKKHQEFLQAGGAGGYWETFYIKNLIFGTYKQDTNQNEVPDTQAKLSFHNLRDIDLEEIVLPYANCASINADSKNLQGADLEGSLFIDSIFNNSSFDEADLYAADFSRSEMRYCTFRGANLVKTDFENCDLTGADFRGATIDDSTLFKNAIMDNVLRD